MSIKHKVYINVTSPTGKKMNVLKGGVCSLPRRFLTALFGENTEVFVLTPGQTIQSVEIHEIPKEGGNTHEPNQSTAS